MYPTPTAALKLISDRLVGHAQLNGLPVYNDEEADTATEGIQLSVMSPGTNYGFVDGKREFIDPLIGVLVFGPNLEQCEARSAIVAASVEGLSGNTALGFVLRLAQERPYHDTVRLPSKGVRHVVGGLYRAQINPSQS